MAKQWRLRSPQTSAGKEGERPHFPSSFTHPNEPLITRSADDFIAGLRVRRHRGFVPKPITGPVVHLLVGEHHHKVVATIGTGRNAVVVKGSTGLPEDQAVVDAEIHAGYETFLQTEFGSRRLPRVYASDNPHAVIVMQHIPRAENHRDAVVGRMISEKRAKRAHDEFVRENALIWLQTPSEALRAKGDYSMQREEFGEVQTNIDANLSALAKREGIPDAVVDADPEVLKKTEIFYQEAESDGPHLYSTSLGYLIDRIGKFYTEEQHIPSGEREYWGNLDLNPKNRLSSRARLLPVISPLNAALSRVNGVLHSHLRIPEVTRGWKFVDLEMVGRIDPAEAMAAAMKYGSADQLQIHGFGSHFEQRAEGNRLYVDNLSVGRNPQATIMQEYAWNQVPEYQELLSYPGSLAANTAMYYAGKLLHELAYIDKRNKKPGAATALIVEIAHWVREYERLKPKQDQLSPS